MKRFFSLMAAGAAFLHLAAQSPALEGFLYGNQAAPTGKEWESVEELSLNKEQPHAYFFSFENVESARKYKTYMFEYESESVC